MAILKPIRNKQIKEDRMPDSVQEKREKICNDGTGHRFSPAIMYAIEHSHTHRIPKHAICVRCGKNINTKTYEDSDRS